MRLIDQTTGAAPVLTPGDRFTMEQTITVTPNDIIVWPDALLEDGEEVTLCRVIKGDTDGQGDR